MGRTVDNGRVVPEDVLRAVAMMHVEIDDRDPFGAVGRLGVARGDGRVVEEAEAHRGRDFGVVPRRARRDEGVANLAADHFVDGETAPPAERNAASYVPGDIDVSWSISVSPCFGVAARIASI